MFQWLIVSLLPLSSFFTDVCSVPPPTNLSMHCHNFKNVLYWNYSEPNLQPIFSVTIRHYRQEPESLRAHQNYLDISPYTQKVDSAYFVSVAAQMNKSVQSSHISTQFSYGEFPAKIKCIVDFPPLNISVWSRKFAIHFYHPFYIYGTENLNDTFTYTIEYNEIESTFSCFVEDRVCKEMIQLPESLYGKCMDIHLKGSVKELHTKISRQICNDRPDTKEIDMAMILTIIVCGGIVLVMGILVGCFLYMKRTQITSQSSVFSKILSMVRSEHSVVVPEQPTVSPVTSVSQTPLLDIPEDDVYPQTSPSPTNVTHFPIRVFNNVESSGSQDPEDMVEEEDSEDVKSSSGYECGKFLVVMSPGDTVDAYGPRQT